MSTKIRTGSMVTVGESPSLWVVQGFALRVGGHLMVEVAPLGGGGSKMTAPVERLRVNGEAAK